MPISLIFSQYDNIVDCIDTVTGKLEITMRANALKKLVIIPPQPDVSDDDKDTGFEDTLGATPERQKLARKGETKKQAPGSNAFVPSAAGMIIAAEVVKDLTQFHVTDLFKESKN